jgi:hypothetical protein
MVREIHARELRWCVGACAEAERSVLGGFGLLRRRSDEQLPGQSNWTNVTAWVGVAVVGT